MKLFWKNNKLNEQKENNFDFNNFDLNIDTILENWNPKYAVREIISNALDETKMSNVKEELKIYKEKDCWIIRDFGSGIKLDNFVENENSNKKNRTDVIGKFGIGLKDALAVFYNYKIDVEIYSKYGFFTLIKKDKNNFKNIKTLHIVKQYFDSNFIGTEFKLKNISENDIIGAKEFFLFFSKKNVFDKNEYGEIYIKDKNRDSFIYVNGMKIAEDPNLFFDYNISKMDMKIQKALNRERMDLKRSVYSEKIKQIILKSNKALSNLEKFLINPSLKKPDELSWVDVEKEIAKNLFKNNPNIIFLRGTDNSPEIIERINNSSKTIIYSSYEVYDKLNKELEIKTFDKFVHEKNMEYIKFQENICSDLNSNELNIFNLRFKIIDSFFPSIKKEKWNFFIVKNIPSTGLLGLTDNDEKNIFINRRSLKDKNIFLTTLCHELVHANSGFPDLSLEFENSLSNLIGEILFKINF